MHARIHAHVGPMQIMIWEKSASRAHAKFKKSATRAHANHANYEKSATRTPAAPENPKPRKQEHPNGRKRKPKNPNGGGGWGVDDQLRGGNHYRRKFFRN